MKATNFTVYAVEGNLYEVNLEDGIGLTFDTVVRIRLSNGDTYQHRSFYASGKGTCTDPETGRKENTICRSRELAQVFAARIEAKGEVDLDLWDKVPQPESLESRLDGYAMEEAMERAGYVR